jgi:hypothetical protein
MNEKIEYCQQCNKKIDLNALPIPNDVTVVNYYEIEDSKNNNIFLCCKACQESCVALFLGCVVCNNICESSDWYVAITYTDMGGFTEVKVICSEKCHKTVVEVGKTDLKHYFKCRHCQKQSETPIKRCSKCHVAYYCDAECQKADWKSHKLACK